MDQRAFLTNIWRAFRFALATFGIALSAYSLLTAILIWEGTFDKLLYFLFGLVLIYAGLAKKRSRTGTPTPYPPPPRLRPRGGGIKTG